jgi:hypothetical protein
MKVKSALITILFLVLLTACNLTSSNPDIEPSNQITLPPTSLPFPTSLPPAKNPTAIVLPQTTLPISLNQAVLDRASEVIQILKTQDMVSLSNYIHPTDGVRFSPYAYVKDSDQVFSSTEIANILADSSVYTWGAYSGTGEPIDLSFPEYYSKFIYDQNFADAPEMSLNYRLGGGNSIDNSSEFYPEAKIVEYYFSGFDPQYGGMDWRSLRMVFSELNDTWYLVGVIHDEWTP